jgi:hypothetical protein
MAANVFILGADLQVVQSSLDLHIQIKIGIQECTWLWRWVLDKSPGPCEPTLVVQEEPKTA